MVTGTINGHTNGSVVNGSANGQSHAVPIVDPTAARRDPEPIKINSSNVAYSEEYITAKYSYSSNSVKVQNGKYEITPVNKDYTFRTSRKVPKTGYDPVYQTYRY